MDSTRKFDGYAKDYAVGRPSYALDLINCLYERYGISEKSVIADIGSGTGKFAKHLLERGSQVYCVEPNDDMRQTAEKELGSYEKFLLTIRSPLIKRNSWQEVFPVPTH